MRELAVSFSTVWVLTIAVTCWGYITNILGKYFFIKILILALPYFTNTTDRMHCTCLDFIHILLRSRARYSGRETLEGASCITLPPPPLLTSGRFLNVPARTEPGQWVGVYLPPWLQEHPPDSQYQGLLSLTRVNTGTHVSFILSISNSVHMLCPLTHHRLQY